MNHYTYVIHNTITGRYYIGVRSSECGPQDDNKYWGSSKYLKAECAIDPENWIKYIIQTYPTRAEANSDEVECIRGHLGNGRCINLAEGGNALTGFIMTADQRQKISIGNRGKKKSPEHCKAIALARKTAKRPSRESRVLAGRNAGFARRGKPLSAEHRAAIAKSQIGKKRIFSDSHKAALRAAHERRRARKHGTCPR